MKIKKALCLLVALAIAASLGAAPVFAEDADVNMDFQEAPNENDGSVDVSEEFAGDVVYDFGIQTPDAEDNGDIDLMSIVPSTNGDGTIIIRSVKGAGVQDPTFTVQIGDEISNTGYRNNFTSNDSTNDLKGNDIIIKAADGYTLKNVSLEQGFLAEAVNDNKAQVATQDVYYKRYKELVNTNLSDFYSAEENKVTLKNEVLFRTVQSWISGNKKSEWDSHNHEDKFIFMGDEVDKSSGFGGSITSGTFEVVVSTEAKKPGDVKIENSDSEGTELDGSYGYDGHTLSTMQALQDEINGKIEDGELVYNDTVSFTYNKDVITNVNVRVGEAGLGTDFKNGSVNFKVGDKSITVTVTFKKKAKGVTFDKQSAFPKNVTAVTVGGKTYNIFSALDGYLTSLYAGESVDLEIVTASGWTVQSATVDGKDAPVTNNTVKGVTLDGKVVDIVIVLKSGTPKLSFSQYKLAGSDEGEITTAFGKVGQLVIAAVNNVDQLSDAALTNAHIDLEGRFTSAGGNPNGFGSGTKYDTIYNSQDISKDAAYAGFAFVPNPDSESIQYTYTVSVTATLSYNRGSNTAKTTGTFTVGNITE